MTGPRMSLAEQFSSDPEHRVAMAAANAAVDAVALLNRAVRMADISNKTLASNVGVSEGRVSQVLNGDGNVRVSTLARFLRAAGYRLELNARPADEGVPPLLARTRGVRNPVPRYIAVIEKTVISEHGVGPETVVQVSRSHPSRLGDRYTAVIDLVDGTVEGSSRRVDSMEEQLVPDLENS